MCTELGDLIYASILVHRLLYSGMYLHTCTLYSGMRFYSLPAPSGSPSTIVNVQHLRARLMRSLCSLGL